MNRDEKKMLKVRKTVDCLLADVCTLVDQPKVNIMREYVRALANLRGCLIEAKAGFNKAEAEVDAMIERVEV